MNYRHVIILEIDNFYGFNQSLHVILTLFSESIPLRLQCIWEIITIFWGFHMNSLIWRRNVKLTLSSNLAVVLGAEHSTPLSTHNLSKKSRVDGSANLSVAGNLTFSAFSRSLTISKRLKGGVKSTSQPQTPNPKPQTPKEKFDNYYLFKLKNSNISNYNLKM